MRGTVTPARATTPSTDQGDRHSSGCPRGRATLGARLVRHAVDRLCIVSASVGDVALRLPRSAGRNGLCCGWLGGAEGKHFDCPRWIRTTILGSKVRCPAIGRGGSNRSNLHGGGDRLKHTHAARQSITCTSSMRTSVCVSRTGASAARSSAAASGDASNTPNTVEPDPDMPAL